MIQRLEIIGTMGKDPDLRYTPEGKATTTITVATNRNTANGQRETTWFHVICWEKTAEYLSKYAQKGAKIYASGRLVVDPQTGGPRIFKKQDGSVSTSFEMVAETVKLISGYKSIDGQQNQQGQQKPQQQYQQRTAAPQKQAESYDDIPW